MHSGLFFRIFMRPIFLFLSVAFGVNVLLAPTPTWAFGPKRQAYLMANIGDSITAGTFADTSTFLPFSFFQTIQGSLALDSFKTLAMLENKKSYSWASGEWIDSHYVRLKRHLEKEGVAEDLDVMNVAVPGSVAENTLAQAQRVVDAMKSGRFKELKYVTLLIGANDACSSQGPFGTRNDAFQEHLRATFRKLAEVEQAEPIRVLVSSMPDIPLLGRPEIRHHTTLGVMSCDYFRYEVLGFCKSLTRWNGEEDFREKAQVVLEKNEVIRSVVEESARLYPNLDLAFSTSLERYNIDTDLLAMDCFHPNKDGQAILSDLLWRDQRWFK